MSSCGKKPDADPVIARVGQETVTRRQLQIQYGLPTAATDLTTDSLAASLGEAARDWCQQEILIQEARKRGLDQDSLFLAQVENLRRELLVSRLYRRTEGNAQVDSIEAKAEYQSRIAEFRASDDQVDLVYLIAPTRESANAVRHALQQGEELTVILTQDENLLGENVGWVSAKDLEASVARLAFNLVPGGVSFPQKREDGRYIVVFVRQRRLAGTFLPFAEVEEEIHTRLLLRQQTETEKALRDSLWAVYRPEILITGSGSTEKIENDVP